MSQSINTTSDNIPLTQSVDSSENNVVKQIKTFWSSSQRNLILSTVVAAIIAILIVVLLFTLGLTRRINTPLGST